MNASSPTQELECNSRDWNCYDQGANIHQPARHLTDNIETNTIESNDLNSTIDPMESIAPTAEIGSPGMIFDAALDEALDSVLMATHPPSMDAYNQPTSSQEEKQTLYNARLATISPKESYNWATNQTAHSFANSQHHSSIGLSPTSFLNTSQDDYIELDSLNTPELGPIGHLSPTPNDIWLDNPTYFAGLAGAGQGMEPIATMMGGPEKRTTRKQADEFEYVLGGIGGEVPLIQ